MKRSLIGFTVCTAFTASMITFLVLTNPRHKDIYIARMARRIQVDCCQQQSQGIPQTLCEFGLPLLRPSIGGLLNMYTEKPANYGLFTVYTTHAPTLDLDIYALGIGGQFIVWPPQLMWQNNCSLLSEALQEDALPWVSGQEHPCPNAG